MFNLSAGNRLLKFSKENCHRAKLNLKKSNKQFCSTTKSPSYISVIQNPSLD